MRAGLRYNAEHLAAACSLNLDAWSLMLLRGNLWESNFDPCELATHKCAGSGTCSE